MPRVKAFQATRPTRDKVGLIASRPYESYTKEEREARLDHNPFSFLHIVNPGYKYHKEISGRKAFKLVKNRFEEFKEDQSFIQEKQKSFYIHRIVHRNTKVFTGIIGAVHADDYETKIKIHEDVLTSKVSIFSEYLETVRFNADPILITYPKNDALQDIIETTTQVRPEYEFTTTSRETHYLWVVDNEKSIQQIEKIFVSMPNLYLADGHHRCSSSVQLATHLKDENPSHKGDEPYNYIMSYLIEEDNLEIREFNRLVKDLNGLGKEEFLIRLDEYFRIENRGLEYYKPSKKHHFSMYLDGEFYSLHLRKNLHSVENALDDLDTYVLYKYILRPILGIEDLSKSKRIAYSKGQREMAYVKGKVDEGEFAVGFGLFPVSIEEIKNIADQGLKMPPKSTYIEPKLRSGITILEF